MKETFEDWWARVVAQHAEWARLAAIRDAERQAELDAAFPASEGWLGSAEGLGYRMRNRPQPGDPALDAGAYI